MSTPPLNEDEVHVHRTPNHNIASKLGMMNPIGYPFKYSYQVGEQEDPPIALLPGISPWHE